MGEKKYLIPNVSSLAVTPGPGVLLLSVFVFVIHKKKPQSRSTRTLDQKKNKYNIILIHWS